jgi:NDP-mannose synthase
MHAVILAGGKGARLQPYTKLFPKPLIPLDDIPILQIILLQLRQAGFSRVTLAVWYKSHYIERYFGDGHWLGLDIQYSRAEMPLGTAGPLGLLPPFDAPFLVMNADVLTNLDYLDVYLAHQRNRSPATVVLYRHTVGINFGVVDIDNQQQIVHFIEKPELSMLINSGIYVLDPSVTTYIQKGIYLDMPDLLHRLMADQYAVQGYVFEGAWFDIGTPEQYQRADEEFRQHHRMYLKNGDADDDGFASDLIIDQLGLWHPFKPAQDQVTMTLLWR